MTHNTLTTIQNNLALQPHDIAATTKQPHNNVLITIQNTLETG